MIIKDLSSDVRSIRGVQSSEDFALSLNAKMVPVSGGTSGTTTIKDAYLASVTGATINSLSDVVCSQRIGSVFGTRTPTFTSLATGVATVDSSGVTTYVGDGTGLVSVTVPQVGTRQVSFPCQQQAGQTTYTLNNFVSGSLGAALVSTVAGYMSGKSPGSSTQQIYSSEDDTNFLYTRNTSLFTGSLDLTCIPVFNTSTLKDFLGIAVTPLHVLGAHHAPMANGSTLYFVTNGNATVSRTISNQMQVGTTDIQVYLLSSALPGTITPAYVLPSNWASYLPQPGYGYPGLTRRQNQQIYTADFVNDALNLTTMIRPSDATRQLWYNPIVVGDSGSPGFLPIGGYCVALTQWTSSNLLTAATGPSNAGNTSAINAALSSLGGGYSLTAVSLSAYNAY